VKYKAAKVRAVAEQAIRTAVQTKDSPAALINVALEELVRARCELPGYTTLDAMAATIRTEVNAGVFALVSPRPRRGPSGPGLERMLVVDPATRGSEFDRIKTPAQAATPHEVSTRSAKLHGGRAPAAVPGAAGPVGAEARHVLAVPAAHFGLLPLPVVDADVPLDFSLDPPMG
jgi:hypothetical protein